jgi:hypothetical protein
MGRACVGCIFDSISYSASFRFPSFCFSLDGDGIAPLGGVIAYLFTVCGVVHSCIFPHSLFVS